MCHVPHQFNELRALQLANNLGVGGTLWGQSLSKDEQYLRILSVFYYLSGCIVVLFACFPIIHLTVDLGLPSVGLGSGSTETIFLAPIGLFFILIAGNIIVLGWAFAVCMIIAGCFLTVKRNYIFCLVMAGVACVFMPFGAVLGLLAIITLTKPTVKEPFQAHRLAQQTG